MEFRYSIHEPEQLLRLHCCGPVTAGGVIKMMKHIGGDGRFHRRLSVLADMREATGDWDYSEAQSFRDYLVRIGSGPPVVRWAAVLSPGTLIAACHIVILITDPKDCGIRMRLFEDTALAEHWLLAGHAEHIEAVELRA